MTDRSAERSRGDAFDKSLARSEIVDARTNPACSVCWPTSWARNARHPAGPACTSTRKKRLQFEKLNLKASAYLKTVLFLFICGGRSSCPKTDHLDELISSR